MILIGAITLIINYKIVKSLFGESTSLIFIILASVEPSTIFHTKLDWGPTTLMMFFRGLSILFLIYFLNTKKYKYLIYFTIITLLGIYDKANFIWIPISLIITVLFISKIDLYKKIITIFSICFFIFSFSFYTGEISLPT